MSSVNHPNHYNVEGHKECIVEMQETFGTLPVIFFSVLNAFKYQYRAGYKNSQEEDLRKAEWYTCYASKLLFSNIVLSKITKILFPKLYNYLLNSAQSHE